MKTLVKYGAIASAFLMTAGTAALAQNYDRGYNQGYDTYWQKDDYNVGPGRAQSSGQDWGRQGWDQRGTQGGGQGWNRQGWDQHGMQGGGQGWDRQGWQQGRDQRWGQHRGTQAGMQGTSGSGSGMEDRPSQQEARQELSKYGYNNVRNLEPVQGWSARATKNGDPVHVVIDDNGMVATYRGD